MDGRPERTRVYKTAFFDSTRWLAFEPRDGDVIVSTPPKSGTTWTQMICALLIHGKPDLPAPLAELSPWLDMELAAKADVLARYAAQPGRRVIKTHTPLDGLPFWERVHYVFCARDPRDAFISSQNHRANADRERIDRIMADRGIDYKRPPPPAGDIDARFREWLTDAVAGQADDGGPKSSPFNHAATFWPWRHLPNLHFLHYADLKADLAGQMRRLSMRLGLPVDAAAWPALIEAATFESMKANADRAAPDTDHGIWVSNAGFFNKGENAQWRRLLSDESLALYTEMTRARYPTDMLDWLEGGARGAG